MTCGLVSWLICLHPVLRYLEDWSQDAAFAYRDVRDSRTKVVIVGLDDLSLDDLPKPMAFFSPEYAEVVGYLKARGASAIGMDVMVPESLDDFPGVEGDSLGIEVAAAENVVLPAVLRDDGHLLLPLRAWRFGETLALVNMDEDADHFLRRQRLGSMADGEVRKQFALALLDVAGRVDTDADHVYVDGRMVPLDEENRLRINFKGPAGTIPEVAFREVLAAARGEAPSTIEGGAMDFEGAVVIVGATARSLGDYHATPYANGSWRGLWAAPPRLMSGPEVQANIVATLADGAYITTPWWLSSLPQVLILGGVLGWALSRLSLVGGFLLTFAHHWAWKAVSLAAFWYGHWRVEVVAMLITGALCYTATFAFRWRWLRSTFGVVKGEAIARALEADPAHILLKGQRRELTVLFSDIRDFTTFSESHSPEEVVTLLNAYFTAVVPAIEAEGGSVDKYMGDGIMALFGAPDAKPDHAARAVRAAVIMVEAVHSREGRWAELGFPGLRIGVGVHTGPAVVGTIGSPRRLDYTAIGDTVNAAARIEAQNKPFGSEILISSATCSALPPSERSRLGCRERSEPALLKGKSESLELHRVDVGACLEPE